MKRVLHTIALVTLGLAAACTGIIEDSTADPEEREPGRAGPEAPEAASPTSEDFAPVSPVARRLTRDEYLYTVEDVLGVSLSERDAEALPVDRPLEGFVNVASGQTVLPDHVRAYDALAERITEQMDFDAFVAKHGSCRDPTEECGRSFVEGAGALLFRRPLDEAERTSFTDLFLGVVSEDLGFVDAARAVVHAMLQSPQFLYLLEVERADDFDGLRRVQGYEMASRLSYMLWASAPDPLLYEAAERGDLDEPAGILAQVERMLEHRDKTRRVLRRFLLDWARLQSLPDEDGLRGELTDSALTFYTRHVEQGRSLFDLFTEQRAFLTPALAERYGLEPEAEGIHEYDLTDAPGRVGLLAQPGVVAGMTNADGGAIVARGLFLQRQLFCSSSPDPPASLEDEIDSFVEEQPEDASDRQVAEARLEREQCAACHAQFDPLAYGLEQLDFRGGFRTEDEHGNALHTDGWVPGALSEGADLPYEDLEQYAQLLGDSTRVARCMTQRQLEYALGSRLHPQHRGSVEEIADELRDAGGSYDALIRILSVHDVFRLMPVD